MKTVYLAGPIAGCDKAEANDWREEMAERLARYNIRGISPLRCEPVIGDRYGLTYHDEKFGSARAICSKNEFDTRNCDMVLCYLPRALNDKRPSYGTIMELAWAYLLNKRPILVTDCPVLRKHPLVNSSAGWVLRTLDEAEAVIVGILGDYAQPIPSDLRASPAARRKARRAA